MSGETLDLTVGEAVPLSPKALDFLMIVISKGRIFIGC